MTCYGPLYQVLKKSVQWEWTEQHTGAVSQLKPDIVKALMLITPNPEVPDHREEPVSVNALAAVASQERHGKI